VVLNIRLTDRTSMTPDQHDSLGRSWYGYDPTVSSAALWRNNRGRWNLSAERLEDERWATFTYDGTVVLVVELDAGGHDTVAGRKPGQARTALRGRPLDPAHPVAAALLGRHLDLRGRNPVSYLDDLDPELEPLASAPGWGAAVLLTWNPERGEGSTAHIEEAVVRTASGEVVDGDWSTGGRTGGLHQGDRAFLLRQGRSMPGLIGSGFVQSPIFVGKHWDGRNAVTNYVDVQWDTVLAPEDALPLAELEQVASDQHWTPQSSGTLLKPEHHEAVELAWTQHVLEVRGSVPRPAGGGQGPLLDAVRRKLIEDAAQDRLTAYFEDDGWDVDDTRFGNPYDAVARKGRAIRYLEAKGTQTDGAFVRVTRGEVAHARTHRGTCMIGIWSGMRFLDDSTIDPAVGDFRVLPFDPDAGFLAPVDYEWTPPAAGLQ
jgi:hypothetical protein